MSNKNSFWAKRFGYIHKDGTLALVCSGFGGTSRTASKEHQKNRKPPDDVKQSNRDKANRKIMLETVGYPSMHYSSTGKKMGIK